MGDDSVTIFDKRSRSLTSLDIVISNPRQGDNAFGVQATAETSQIEIHNFHLGEPSQHEGSREAFSSA